jgi:hypothetical protein
MPENDFSAKYSFWRAHIRRLHRKIRYSGLAGVYGAEADIDRPMAPAQSVENEPEPTASGLSMYAADVEAIQSDSLMEASGAKIDNRRGPRGCA